MRIFRWMARFICTLLFVVVGIYAGIALCIIGFILCGVISPGALMFPDTPTPTVLECLGFIGLAIVVMVPCALVRTFGARTDSNSNDQSQ
ncbi:MAG: hypothetical protein ABI680_20765 [Chthoniobacteraceae bacterium]